MKNIHELWAAVDPSRPIVFWGAAMTGRAIAKMVQRFGLRMPELFVDSSSAFEGTSYYGVPVKKPDLLWTEAMAARKPFVFVSVALLEAEISAILDGRGYVKGVDYATIGDIHISIFPVDIVGACNLRCPSCARGNADELTPPPTGMMSVELFTKILDKIGEVSQYVPYIPLYNWGDTLLHPKLFDILAVMRERQIFSAASSNFSMEYDVKGLVRSGLDELKISCSGFYQDTYTRTHTAGDIRLVKSNMYKLRYYMDKIGNDMAVKIEYHLYRDNRGRDLDAMRKLCEELGFMFNAYYAIVTPVEKIIDHLDGRSHDLDGINDQLAVSIEDGVRIAKQFHVDECTYYNQNNIAADGSVLLCCVSYNSGGNILGNFLTTPLEQIEAAKRTHPLCGPCLEHGVPQFIQNLGAAEREKLVRGPTRVEG